MCWMTSGHAQDVNKACNQQGSRLFEFLKELKQEAWNKVTKGTAGAVNALETG